MKFALLVTHRLQDLPGVTEGMVKNILQEHDAFTAALKKAGVLVNDRGFRLHPPNEMLRVKDKALYDGPHAETKEVVGGVYLIDVKDRDEAARWAKQHPVWPNDAVEIREIVEC